MSDVLQRKTGHTYVMVLCQVGRVWHCASSALLFYVMWPVLRACIIDMVSMQNFNMLITAGVYGGVLPPCIALKVATGIDH